MGESDLSLNVIDKIIGLLLVVGIVLAPWMLGTTTNTGVFVLNFINLLLGVCVLFKRILKIKKENYGGGSRGCGNAKYIVVGSFSSASLFLAYVLVSAFNANSVIHYTYYPATHEATGVEIEYLNPITWLPHSYDKDLSLRAFWKYLSCACAFMAMREWLLGGSDWKKVYDQTDNQFPNLRMQIILWSISISTGALGFVGMLQRLDGTEKLLWIYDNHINGGQGAFGPFPYQSSGAQYLNLMWPVMLGFWWILRRQSISRTERGRRLGVSVR
jgi:hypothetical protein